MPEFLYEMNCVQFERRTEASAQARLLRPDNGRSSIRISSAQAVTRPELGLTIPSPSYKLCYTSLYVL